MRIAAEHLRQHSSFRARLSLLRRAGALWIIALVSIIAVAGEFGVLQSWKAEEERTMLVKELYSVYNDLQVQWEALSHAIDTLPEGQLKDELVSKTVNVRLVVQQLLFVMVE